MNDRRRANKLISMAVSILIFTTQGPLMALGAAKPSENQLNQLTLTAALEQAYKSNKTLTTTQNQLSGKGLEIEGIENQLSNLAKAQGGLNLEYSQADEVQKKANSETVALISSLNLKKDELIALKWAYEDAINTMTYNVKVLYYDLLENTEAYNYELENANKLEEAYLKLYPQYLQGLVKAEVIKANRENYDSSQERQVKTLLAIDQLKAKLTTQLGGKDIGSLTYDGNLPDLSISDGALDQLYPYGVHHSVQLMTLEKNLDAAQTVLEEMNDIYHTAYGEQSKWIYPILQENQVDYPLLFENFNAMIASQPKEGLKLFYPLRYGFFKVNTPESFFMEKPTALSMMAESSPLTEALSQREEKRGLVTEGYTTLQKNYRAAYEAYKQLEYDLEQLRETLIIDTAILEKLKKSNLKGLTTYFEVQTMMLKVNEEKRRERVLHIKLNKSIAELDFVSAGAVRALGKLDGFEQVSGGLITAEKATEGFWQVESPVDYYGFVFTVRVPEALKVTHYQLYDPDGKALSEPVAINASFRHVSLPYAKGPSLKLVLYQKDKVLKTILLSGDKISGRF